jgi:hypothetical protein
MDDKEAYSLAAKDLGLIVKQDHFDKQSLVDKVNDLLQHDFQKLVFLLYRIDIDENKLKGLLNQQTGEDAAVIITDLIIERQIQKIRSREQFRPKGDDIIDDEEKW